MLVRAWQPGRGRVALRAEPVDAGSLSLPPPGGERAGPAGPEQLALALERMRFALGVDDDLGEFYRRFRRDPLLGPLIRRRPHLRPLRRPWAWEALAWAVVKQLIESGRAARIQRRIVGRWGLRLGGERGAALRDVPPAELIAGRAPAELEALGLSPGALGRPGGDRPPDRRRPLRPGRRRRPTAASSRFRRSAPGRSSASASTAAAKPDSLPAGDLMYLKLVGRLARLGRRATVEEVEEFFAPYRPFRGLAAVWTHIL